MISLTAEQTLALPRNLLRAPAPRTEDAGAHAELAVQLEDAAMALMALGEDPVAIAASPNRFNDIYWSEWQAIRSGSFFTERHDYSRRDYDGDLEKGPESARKARAILDNLERIGWRDLFTDAFAALWTDQILALVIQAGIPWLVFSGSCQSDANFVFAIWGEQSLRYFGECKPRLDWDLQETVPLQFQELPLGE